MLIMLVALACAHKDHHDDSAAEATATVSFLAPLDEELVVLGDNSASLLVEGFTLVDVERHNEGTPEGFVRLSLDGVMVAESGLTQLRVYFQLDDNDDAGNDYLGYYAGETSTAAYRPQLVLTYQ